EPEELRWWELFGNLKWGVICMMQASAHTSGALRSVELAAIGRRVCEVEWDLLEVMPATPGVDGVSEWAPPDPGAPTSDLYGVPDAATLVEAAREYLEGDVMAATDGRVRFHARVAANVLGMVEREIRLGPSHRRQHAAGLARLGVSDEAELARAIRDGTLVGREAEVREFLHRSVRAKVEVAHPSYLEGPRPPA